MGNPKYPFGPADSQTVEAAAAVELTISNTKTIVDLGELGAAMALTAVIEEDMPVGAELHIKALSDGTARDITFGAGFTAPVLAGVISKTKMVSFVYDGTTFVQSGAAIQLD